MTSANPAASRAEETTDFGKPRHDPYRIFVWLRRENPIPFVPAAGHFFVTKFEDVVVRTSRPRSLMHRVMGHSFMRPDSRSHSSEGWQDRRLSGWRPRSAVRRHDT